MEFIQFTDGTWTFEGDYEHCKEEYALYGHVIEKVGRVCCDNCCHKGQTGTWGVKGACETCTDDENFQPTGV